MLSFFCFPPAHPPFQQLSIAAVALPPLRFCAAVASSSGLRRFSTLLLLLVFLQSPSMSLFSLEKLKFRTRLMREEVLMILFYCLYSYSRTARKKKQKNQPCGKIAINFLHLFINRGFYHLYVYWVLEEIFLVSSLPDPPKHHQP